MSFEKFELTFYVLVFIAILVIIIVNQYITISRLNKELLNLNSKIKSEIQELANEKINEFKDAELGSIKKEIQHFENQKAELNLEKWKIESEYEIRQDAINRSKSVILGKVTEHLLPFHFNYPYNPKRY